MAATRAAYVGGCAGTSNVLAGKAMGIPVKGTQAHSWVMAFDSELEAFRAFARAAPNNCIFLVDTYDSLEGTRNAVKAADDLRRSGHEMVGIRLDSGDLAYLSIEARRILDEAGFKNAIIVGSGDLDEHVIESLKSQGAAIDAWGVGTRLVTGGYDPALTAIYKLTAIRREDGRWQPRVKLSEQLAKTSIPGILQVQRFSNGGLFAADAIYDEQIGIEPAGHIADPQDPTRTKPIGADWAHEDLLQPVLQGGRMFREMPSIQDARERCRRQLYQLHTGIKRLLNPHQYPAGLEHRLDKLRTSLIKDMRQGRPRDEGSKT